MERQAVFLRFASAEVDRDSQCEEGLFQAAGRLLESGRLESHEEEQLRELLDWFNRNLRVPRCASRRTPPHERTPRAICWFRAEAHSAVARMWELARFLRQHGLPVRFLKVRRPGAVEYEDEQQVMAEPFRDTDLKGRSW